ncbi:MAG: hypothetical protein U0T69_12775 [Chitinophagales bacterium]
MSIPSNITKEHLLKAIEKIDAEGIPGYATSKFYDVIYNNKKYPPKLIVSYANIFANGKELDRNSFTGGLETDCFKLLEDNDFIIKPKQMQVTRKVIHDIIEICNRMVEGRANGEITSTTYSDKFKPFLDQFKNKHNDSPNLILQNILKRFYENNLKDFSPKIEYKNFGYWGRTIYNYTWACLYYNFDHEQIPASYSPQLYILVNRYGIKFGFCYGHHVENQNLLVQSAIDSNNLKILKKTLNQDKELLFYNSSNIEVSARPETLFGKEERIIINTENDIISNWSRNSLLIKEYPKESIPENIEDIINETLYNLKDFYLSLLPREKIETKQKHSPVNFNYELFVSSIIDANIKLSKEMGIRFTASLLTKPFVILTGLSGSGKTKLAQAFAKWICEDDSQYCIVPVGADWTNREPLLGFPNALKPNDYAKPDNKVLNLIINANKNKDKPYFLILDEMNLSHVERYFADFLSVMESKDKISLHSGSEEWNGVPAQIGFPKNLFIIGTVNIDETTYMFSPKVLDRANVIEFRVTYDEMNEYLDNNSEIKLENLEAEGSRMAQSFVSIAKETNLQSENSEGLNKILLQFFSELKKTGAEFGYRTASEILRFAAVIRKLEVDWNPNEIADAAIMQKLLPKVHGSRRKLEPVLKTLGTLCLIDPGEIETLLFKTEMTEEEKQKVKYPISFEKIQRMYQNLLSNGFTSYAEA